MLIFASADAIFAAIAADAIMLSLLLALLFAVVI